MICIVSKDEFRSMPPEIHDEPLLVMEYGSQYIICTMDEYTYMTNDIETYTRPVLQA